MRYKLHIPSSISTVSQKGGLDAITYSFVSFLFVLKLQLRPFLISQKIHANIMTSSEIFIHQIFDSRKGYLEFFSEVYPSKLKNWFLAASALPHIFRPRSRLAYWQWSLAPVGKSEEPPGKITNF